MRILFLDDDANRHKKFQSLLGIKYYPAYTAEEAISFLKSSQFDLVSLDHDLGNEVYVDSFGETPTGYTVAKWIAENKPKIGAIVLHSLNPPGVANMKSILRNDYYLFICPFIYMTDKTIAALIDDINESK